MPNTPALVGEGMTGLFSNSDQRAHGRILAERVMSAVGQCVWVSNESDLDLVTAISGSGPAYFFLFMESLADAAVELGMSPQTAHQLSVQTALGAAKTCPGQVTMGWQSSEKMSQVQVAPQNRPSSRSKRQN